MRFLILITFLAAYITSFSQVTVTITSSTNVSCFGLCDGTAYASASGGVGPYTYLWTPSNITTSAANGLCAGTYYITVADSVGATAVDTVIISEPSLITSTVTTTDDTCGLCVGTASATVFGGTPPYTYSWSPSGITTQWAIGFCAGNYAVTIIDANGCVDYTPVTINYGPGIPCQMGTINGTVYNDVNANCVQNLLENGLANVMLQANPGPYYATTDTNGQYSFVIPYGSYTITQVAQPNYDEICPVAGSYPVVLDSLNNTLINNDFADTITPVQDVGMNLSSGNLVPGFTYNYYLYYSSISNMPMNGTVYLVVADTLTFSYASVVPDLISGDTLFWNYSNLQQFEHRYINAVFQVPAQVGLIGDTLQACAQITPVIGDFNPTDNSVCYDKVVVGSFDPNDKQVEPQGIGTTGDILLTDNELTYTVRFQNTGTAPAVNVVVVDTLSANLEVTTLKNVMASHPFTYEVSGQGILTFTFNNIMLPDSNANEPASHGLIQFTIDQHSSNGIGTVIENTAAIYFDFNPAIVTNTVINTIVAITDINKNEDVLNLVNVYPNPSNGKVNITFGLEKANNVKVKVFDILGQEIIQSIQRKYSSGNYEIKLNIDNIGAGIYFMSIQIGAENHLKKIIIQ